MMTMLRCGNVSRRSPYEESYPPRGYLDFLTWQSRTIRLHPEIDGDGTVIRRASYSQGRVWNATAGFFDPFAAYREGSMTRRPSPLQFRANRDLWRDSAALFQFGETDQFRGPTSLHTIVSPFLEVYRSDRIDYRVIGCRGRVKSGQLNLVFWRHETLPMPLAYLDKSRVGRMLIKVMTLWPRRSQKTWGRRLGIRRRIG